MSSTLPVSEANSLNKPLKSYSVTISINGVMGRLTPYELRMYELYPIGSHQTCKRLGDIWEMVLAKTEAKTHQFIFELSERNKLHIHGMIATSKKFTYKSLQQAGYQVYVRRLESELEERDWYIYTSKGDYMFDSDLVDQQADTLPSVAKQVESKDE